MVTHYVFTPSGDTLLRTDASGQVIATTTPYYNTANPDQRLGHAWGQGRSSGYQPSSFNPRDPILTDPYSWYRSQYGYYEDRSGLYYCLNRYYDVGTLQWISRDPLGYGAGPNQFAYCNNNPVMGVDPLGLDDTFFDPYLGDLKKLWDWLPAWAKPPKTNPEHTLGHMLGDAWKKTKFPQNSRIITAAKKIDINIADFAFMGMTGPVKKVGTAGGPSLTKILKEAAEVDIEGSIKVSYIKEKLQYVADVTFDWEVPKGYKGKGWFAFGKAGDVAGATRGSRPMMYIDPQGNMYSGTERLLENPNFQKHGILPLEIMKKW